MEYEVSSPLSHEPANFPYLEQDQSNPRPPNWLFEDPF